MEEFINNDLKIFITRSYISLIDGNYFNLGLDPRLTLIDMTLMYKYLPKAYNIFLVKILSKNQTTINTEFEINRNSFEIKYKEENWLFSASEEIILHYLKNLDSKDYDHLCSRFDGYGHAVCIYINFKKKQIFFYDAAYIIVYGLYSKFFKNISDYEFKIYFYNGKQVQDMFCESYCYFFMSNILKSMGENKVITIPLLYSILDSSENDQRVSLCKNYLYEIYDRLFVKDKSIYEISFKIQRSGLDRNDFWDLDIKPLNSDIYNRVIHDYNSCFYKTNTKLMRTLSVEKTFENVYNNLKMLNGNSDLIRDGKGLNVLSGSLLKCYVDKNIITKFDIFTFLILYSGKNSHPNKNRDKDFYFYIEDFNCRNDPTIEKHYSSLYSEKYFKERKIESIFELSRLLKENKGVDYYFSFRGSNWPDIEEADRLIAKFIELKNEDFEREDKSFLVFGEKNDEDKKIYYPSSDIRIRDFNCGLDKITEERLIDKFNDYYDFFHNDFKSSQKISGTETMKFRRYKFLKIFIEILKYVFKQYREKSISIHRLIGQEFHGISYSKISKLNNLVLNNYTRHLNLKID